MTSETDSNSEYSYEDEELDSNDDSPKVLSYLAVFGSSSMSLVASFAMLVLSLSVSFLIDDASDPRPPDIQVSLDLEYKNLGPVPTIDPPRVFEVDTSAISTPTLLSDDMREAFDKDGVIALRGLIDEDLLKLLDKDSNELIMAQETKNAQKPKGPLTNRNKGKKGTQFYTVQQGAIFLPQSSNSSSAYSGFSKVALMSSIPALAADLLQLNEQGNETLRVMRDIFLAKDEEEYICGWHVDDTGFWPATAEAPGINAWIALDDMPVERGGGFALAVGSHTAPWKEQAYHVIGSTHTFPREGFKSPTDMAENRAGNGTCNIETAAPHLHRRMEETTRIYDLKRGDVIFHTRWLFHRTVPFNRDVVKDRISNDDDPLLYRRYSVRYGPGYSMIPKGFGLEPSVIWDESNAGRSADEVSHYDAPWYPKVWPHVDEEELEQMLVIANERMPGCVEKAAARRKLIKPRRNSKNANRQPH